MKKNEFVYSVGGTIGVSLGQKEMQQLQLFIKGSDAIITAKGRSSTCTHILHLDCIQHRAPFTGRGSVGLVLPVLQL